VVLRPIGARSTPRATHERPDRATGYSGAANAPSSFAVARSPSSFAVVHFFLFHSFAVFFAHGGRFTVAVG